MSVSDTLIDRVFDGRYRLVRKLGTGGMANVYLAEDQELGRRVAIKMLNERHANDDQFVERFRREAKNAAGLSHPNIVSIYDRGESEGTYYIAMEYLDGRTLKELILTRGPTPIRVAIDYARQILAAVGFAHRHGIVHRDIKPHNVLVAPDGRLKVTDFGIARSGTSQMTEAGSIIGTAQYLSPEQARGAPVDQTSDIYSVGVVLYEMLTGAVPFSGETPVEIAMKHLSSIPEPPSAKRPEVPHDIDMIVLRALAKRPEERYESAEEMAADLTQVAGGGGVSAETTEAATTVLAGTEVAAAAPTAISRVPTAVVPRPPAQYPPAGAGYRYEEPLPPRRSLWPWLAALALLVAAGLGGWYVYMKIQDQLNATKPVAVSDYRGLRELLAVRKIRDVGLTPQVKKEPNDQTDIGFVFDQDPAPGNRIDKGNIVTILVSTGKPKVSVPDVVGQSVAEAVAALAGANLKANVVEINSDKPEGSVTAQSPAPGQQVVKGSDVRINVSKGPKPVPVPTVIGSLFEQASSELQAAGFAVARNDVESDQPKGTVIGTSPSPNTPQPKGSTVTVSVSKGPGTAAVPDVTSLDRATAAATLRSSGFRVSVEMIDTTDPFQDGIVLTQAPAGEAQAKPKTQVTIVVGRFTPPPETTAPPPTDTTPTDTTPTDTFPTDTTPTDTTPTDAIPTTPADTTAGPTPP